MAFDNIDYGAVALTPPIHAHSDATAVGRALGNAAACSYLHLRNQGRRVLDQTTGHYLRSPDTYAAVDFAFASGSWVDVADEPEAWLPSWATRVLARAYFRLPGAGGLITVHHRIVLDDGADQDTGADFVGQIETQPDPDTAQHAGSLSHLEYYADCYVDISSVSLLDADVRVTVQAYAVDEQTAAMRYAPLAVDAFWDIVE